MKDINNDAFRKLGELQISEREEWRINKGRSDFIDINETDSNTIALYRSHIAFKLAPIAKVEPELIFNALDIPIKYENGDLTLPVPKLRLKGDPKQLAAEWKKEVEVIPFFALNFSCNVKLYDLVKIKHLLMHLSLILILSP